MVDDAAWRHIDNATGQRMRDDVIRRVMVTGATGFVGGRVVRELLVRGVTPVCLVRSPGKLYRQHPERVADRLVGETGSITDRAALARAAEGCQAVIHLVGIILARRLRGQTFDRVHRRGTLAVLGAAAGAGIKRFVHMSALGTRAEAVSTYHKTKWAGEQLVRGSGLDWTVFRPSLIHGAEGEFMRLMKRFHCGLFPPVIPYFGDGEAKLQPVSVKDVAHCLVESLFRADTIGETFDLGGPEAFSWVELHRLCRELMPRARRWKPIVSMPVGVAKTIAALSAPPMAVAELMIRSLGLFRF
ncbi:MAG: SDR family oxidoreductase, partial [Phycisphaerae bacterium]